MADYGFSDIECKIITEQIKRRKAMREEFLKQRTNPYKHASEAGYVFDGGIQRFMSLKCCQFDNFQATSRSAMMGLFMVVIPMFLYGTLVYNERAQFERDCRCGKIKYRDRINKFA
ncbi:hypothetical protein MSG28_007240 [Choristoneura fumiferana]|uniref:Uncharacterized protein n=2 Tax=Choristoneura fumiferana TaxID=7141 RepID=A0ACC0JWQ0_CHOFU|nr:hypothetical protein MSG28_009497 [Choristoneura fumiferana]KAI8428417.1 hypothetical protein MSG28_007240 [Choristoneura fumiferana]